MHACVDAFMLYSDVDGRCPHAHAHVLAQARMHACMHVCIPAFIHAPFAHMHSSIRIHAHTLRHCNTQTPANTCEYMRTCANAHADTSIRAHAHTRTCADTSIRATHSTWHAYPGVYMQGPVHTHTGRRHACTRVRARVRVRAGLSTQRTFHNVSGLHICVCEQP